ncbi:MAG: hypothetical protein ROZ37_11675 [Aromatoleum sp.]|jgi:exopolysaccharide biosynthesis operon protein EpsL|uniref:XrtB/PEP-CTERM-associated polysaccharide biosynthesis outer membrane protein EpsL n=1 Tax=Aromatoleum sp. TaxID=2307007 RepID=UPI0028953214|nr:XrtB/PEP-CTERM-associated polysaccharide biosynthesis outer membrane protein EpsL [Aromatoleum sp.]MDT3670976.1 hypothetical protein [Aromatoleum sp.]
MSDVTAVVGDPAPENALSDAPENLRRPVVSLLAVALALGSLPAVAAELLTEREEGFGVRLSHSIRWDDNVFRVPDGERPTDGRSKSDRINRSAVGLTFDHMYSLQRVVASLDVVRRTYDEHDELDSTTKSGLMRWDWAAGKQWTGTAQLQQREAPRSFDDVDRRVRSINTLRRAVFDADYWLHPDWSIVAGAEHTRSRYSDARSAASEYDETAFEAGVGFRPKSGNRLSLVLRRADGEYPNRAATATRDPEYTQRDLRLRGDWVLSGISKLSGYVGYTDREYSTIRNLDFSGPSGRIAFDWQPTGKLAFQVVARREIGSEYEVLDNYVLTRGVGVEAAWSATSKVTLIARAERLRRDHGDITLSSLGEDRRRTYGLSLDYRPLDTVTVSASAVRIKREADAASSSDYDANIYGLDLKLEF